MWGWRGGWIQGKCPPLIGGLMPGGGSDEMARKIKLVGRRGVGRVRARGRSWESESRGRSGESESKAESCGNEGRK